MYPSVCMCARACFFVLQKWLYENDCFQRAIDCRKNLFGVTYKYVYESIFDK